MGFDGNLFYLDLYESKIMSWEACYQTAEDSFNDDPDHVKDIVLSKYEDEDMPDGDIIYKYAEMLFNE